LIVFALCATLHPFAWYVVLSGVTTIIKSIIPVEESIHQIKLNRQQLKTQGIIIIIIKRQRAVKIQHLIEVAHQLVELKSVSYIIS